jgi:hypothetical protein
MTKRLFKTEASIIGFLAGSTLVLAGILITSYKILLNAVKPKTVEYFKNYHNEIGYGRFTEEEFHQLDKEEFNIKSSQGYNIHGYFFDNRSSKTIIIIHGITMNLWSSVKYMKMFMNKGFNVCIYDQRNHGLSGGEFTSLGAYEREDVVTVVGFVKNKVGKDSIVGVHGESMGAATGMMAVGICDDIDFLIEDCGYSSIYEELKVRLKADHQLPSIPFLYVANVLMKLFYGFDSNKESPKKAIAESNTPTLFIHGGKDAYVPTYMAYDLYNSYNGPKELRIFEDSRHAASYVDYVEEYEKVVYSFLENYSFI